jgi:hypothetical protein
MMRNSYWGLVGKAEGINEKMQKWILKEIRVGRCRLHASDSEQAQMVGVF